MKKMKKPRKGREAKTMNEEQEQEVLEETAAQAEQPAAEPQEAPAADPAALQAELDKAKAQAEEYLNLAQHVQADFNNFRRRNESARADSFAEGQRSVAKEMLPVLDNLDRALDSAAEESPLRSGIELTRKQLLAAFEKLGVTEIVCQGEKFDPNLENAVMQGAPEDGEPGTVCMVLMKGYKMGDHVLRHAMVKVVPD